MNRALQLTIFENVVSFEIFSPSKTSYPWELKPKMDLLGLRKNSKREPDLAPISLSSQILTKSP